MSDKKYWSSFAQLNKNNKEAIEKRAQDEFAEELPFGDLDGKGVLDAKTPRRDFLKYLGFSTAAATLAASCKMPVRKAIPYVNRPENVTPGVAKYYASTYVQDGDAVPVLVKVRDGRPIKIEGNTSSPLTLGGTSPRAQASVLDLYDMYRLPHPKKKSGNGFQEVPSYDQVDGPIASALAANGPVVLLTSTITSPSTKQLIGEFLGRYPGSRHVQYDAVSYSALIQANGGRIPGYDFSKANVIVSLGADFLGTWLSPVEFARQYSIGRKIDEGKTPNAADIRMNKHYQFESYLSMTGACADERFTHRPSELGQVVLAIAAGLGVAGATAPTIADAKLKAGIDKVVRDLQGNRGSGLVVSDSNDVNVQTLVAAINAAIGAQTTSTILTRQGLDADMQTLVRDMNAGTIGSIIIYGANPAYDYFDAAAFKTGLAKVKLSVSLNEKLDETTELCQYIVPSHHWLESWGDAESRAGYVSFIQPTIYPLFKTRAFQHTLLKWTGNNSDYETYFRTFWTGRLGSQQAFDEALMDGLLVNGRRTGNNAPTNNQASQATTATATTASIPVPADSTRQQPAATQPGITIAAPVTGGGFATGNVGAAVAALSAARPSTKNEVVLYQSVAVGTGKQAGNPWLLELPDPITRSTWDNYAMISTAKAKELGIDYTSIEYEYETDKPVIEITANGKTVKLPALVIPGMNANTIAIAVGFGRSQAFNPAIYEETGVGVNVYPFARLVNGNVAYTNEVTTSAKPVDTYKIAQIQKHDSYEGRTEVVKETTLASFRETPNTFLEFRQELQEEYGGPGKEKDYRKEGTLYGDHVQPGAKWGMSIDLNSCIGCGACVVACHTENNVPIVGKNEVLRGHEMHWLRIDRYFVTDQNNPDDVKTVVFQPMLCQHCDNAPCENVCPVAATMHSSEGINQMAYNRCIGTRYCANNCPYKVRRFNWSDYTGASTHGRLGPDSGVGKLNQAVHQMNDELTRMVINPDVTTRSRGVMEKCSFCVQRTQAGKLQAKMENRAIGGDEIQSACAQACPTSAIVFGNVNDKNSTVRKIRDTNQKRVFYVLEQLHTLPNVNYLAKIRNTEEKVPHGEGHGGGAEHARQDAKEAVTPQHEPAKEPASAH